MKECEQGAVHRDRLHHSCCDKLKELETDTCIPKPTGRALQYCSEYQKTSHDHSPSCSFAVKQTICDVQGHHNRVFHSVREQWYCVDCLILQADDWRESVKNLAGTALDLRADLDDVKLENAALRKALEKYINVFLPGGVCPANEVFQPGGACAEKKPVRNQNCRWCAKGWPICEVRWYHQAPGVRERAECGT